MWGDRIYKNENGSALILVLIFMMTLLLVAGWLSTQTQTDTKIVRAIKNYSKTFNMADGALELAVYVLRNKYRPSNESVSWNPVKQVADGSKVTVPFNYINQTHPASLKGSADHITFDPKIYWLDYTSTPPPGFGLTEEGYGNRFHTWHYRCEGDSEFSSSGGNSNMVIARSKVRALLLVVKK